MDGSGLSLFHVANIDHYFISAVMILTFLTSTQYLEKYQYSTLFLARRMGENTFKACVMCVKSNSTLVNLLSDMVGLSHHSGSCVNRRKRMQLQLKY